MTMPTEPRADDSGALVEEARKHQAELGATIIGDARVQYCGSCLEPWPCLPARLSDALEAAYAENAAIRMALDELYATVEKASNLATAEFASLREILRAVVEQGELCWSVGYDGYVCFYCDRGEGHAIDCLWPRLNAALAPPEPRRD